MRALTLLGDRKLELVDTPSPPPPGAGDVQIATKAIALNHLDLWGFRGMAFAKRKLPVKSRRSARASPGSRSAIRWSCTAR